MDVMNVFIKVFPVSCIMRIYGQDETETLGR